MEWIIEPNENNEKEDDNLSAYCFTECSCPSKYQCYCSMTLQTYCW